MGFKKATKQQAKLRMAVSGPAGSGKTYTALSIGTAMGKLALIDTERGSASKYADKFTFDVCELGHYNPKDYIKAIHEAEEAGYEVIVIDSMSHAWNGEGGVLEIAGGNFNNWKNATPLQNQMIAAMLNSKCHVISTMRTKMEYVVEEQGGKKVPRKVGMAPVQRDDVQYEFDVHGVMDLAHVMTIDKTRCDAIDGRTFSRPGKDLAQILLNWLSDGAAVVASPPSNAAAASPVGEPSSLEQHIVAGKELLFSVPFAEAAAKLKKFLDGLPAEYKQGVRDALLPIYNELKAKAA